MTMTTTTTMMIIILVFRDWAPARSPPFESIYDWNILVYRILFESTTSINV
jgi:hypothetical protein